MTKNLIPTIAKMLGVAVDEQFKIKDQYGLTKYNKRIYKFDNNGLRFAYDNDMELSTADTSTLVALLNGELEIVKLPWKPQYDQPYWTFRWIANKNRLDVWQNVWFNSVEEVALLKAGWVFRTPEDAQDAQPKVEEEFIAKYGLYKKRNCKKLRK